jgi:hypothetical protein
MREVFFYSRALCRGNAGLRKEEEREVDGPKKVTR